MMNQLLNYKTVITGSSEGIGFGIAQAFARNGADVWLVGRDSTKLKQAHEKLGRSKKIRYQPSWLIFRSQQLSVRFQGWYLISRQ
ncbi:MAG: SDR family NAD(P)-dependent oxidoreductase, partial [Pleurocapsa sp. MO_226.B13]|nr:SDR family NAD(P)-dependent oxidoreductase [Pleurocapsa sp. MO_226.B13]